MTNLTSSEFLLRDFEPVTSFPSWLRVPFIMISITESIFGIVGNFLVIIVISCIGKSNAPHRPYNCFIVNLALSDLVLCLFTMPLNTYRSLNIYMKFPPAFCKLADSFPAINVCVSSLTIVAISIHRYVVVCYPHKKLIGTFLTFIIMIGIWLLAIVAASPLFIYSRSSKVYDEVVVETMAKMTCINSIDKSCEENYDRLYGRLHVCHESWPKHGDWRLVYTIFIFFLQFILPISIICITYYQIMVKLRERFRYRFLIKRHNIASLRHEIRRQRRNNVLLLLIVSSYAISWLPFNISYTVFTYVNRYQNKADNDLSSHEEKVNELSKYLPLRFLICMISAIANPFLYGYFNETFKDGLEKIFSLCCRHMNRRLNEIRYTQSNNRIPEITLKRKQNGSLVSKSSSYQLSLYKSSNNDVSIRPSTRLTKTNQNHLSISMSSAN
ncbi:unnamed protein product [Rotaria sp. Silwood1]|nr:unnamed protein product [Rotaria sp. Silwood1]CAF1274994.1 unnamed protein product [Rotaria sp. Silwood1]CAF1350375.1 unnamed protein product [Rotaria sp. Silwood1]CAF3493510.1 unnamed protein product [Rotaria sp. Silwood1]CAF3516326.1 unnamed protein product [Rotaria sp. Silwood1]